MIEKANDDHIRSFFQNFLATSCQAPHEAQRNVGFGMTPLIEFWKNDTDTNNIHNATYKYPVVLSELPYRYHHQPHIPLRSMWG
ncbi:hypothetical protein Barb4_01618 [Bacteroidales bacterium Barb4]|nr:hypothetical protein Barb4_01618 [Bacteroidales bacterium Barb4]